MKTATIQEIKEALEKQPPGKLLDLCLKVIKSKKENKEFVSYLLFEAGDETSYIENVKLEIDDQFAALPLATLYLTKKAVRKILRSIAKYARHIGNKQAETEMRIHFCRRLLHSGLPLNKSAALGNLYLLQVKKVNELINSLHEDLRFDYTRELEALT